MAKTLSEDLRKRIVIKREEGYSQAEVSQMFGVSSSSVYRFFRKYGESGDVQPKKRGQPEGSKLDPHKELICHWIGKEPGLTLEEITARLGTELELQVHHTTVMRVLAKWGYSYKKNSLRQRTKSP